MITKYSTMTTTNSKVKEFTTQSIRHPKLNCSNKILK